MMVQHRCTRCKEDVGEYGIRHKYAQGLFCEKCLRALRGGLRIIPSGLFGFGDMLSFVGRTLRLLREFITRPFTHRITVKLEKEARRVDYNTMKVKARDILRDARIVSPQKR